MSSDFRFLTTEELEAEYGEDADFLFAKLKLAHEKKEVNDLQCPCALCDFNIPSAGLQLPSTAGVTTAV